MSNQSIGNHFYDLKHHLDSVRNDAQDVLVFLLWCTELKALTGKFHSSEIPGKVGTCSRVAVSSSHHAGVLRDPRPYRLKSKGFQ